MQVILGGPCGRRPVGEKPHSAADEGDRRYSCQRDHARKDRPTEDSLGQSLSRPSGRAAIASPRRKRLRSSASAAAVA